MNDLLWATITFSDIPDDNQECPICLTNNINVISSCGHLYCNDCVITYMRSNNNEVCCAQCRNPNWLPCKRIRYSLNINSEHSYLHVNMTFKLS